MYKNNSKGKSYYTQRNNKIKPASSCNVTSIILALSAAGWPIDKMASNGKQPEDELLRFIMTDKVVEGKWKQLDPAGIYPPNEWHECLALGANRWLSQQGYKQKGVIFLSSLTLDQIISNIEKGGSAVVSGKFKDNGREIDHVVAVVGYEDSGLIIDDPWGDYRDEYATIKGNDIPLARADFFNLVKPQGRAVKYGHLVAKYIDREGKKKDEESFFMGNNPSSSSTSSFDVA